MFQRSCFGYVKTVLFILSYWVAQPVASASLQLSLPSALHMALSANKDIAVSQLSLEGDHYLVDAAQAEFEVKIVPTLSVGKASGNSLFANSGGSNSNYGVQLQKKFVTGTTVSVGPTHSRVADTSNTTVNLAINQPLLKGLGSEVNLDRTRRAEFSVFSSTQNFEQAKINTALETIRTFYEALQQRKIAEINQSLAERLHQHALITSNKEKVGLTGPMDTYRAEIRLKDAEDLRAQAGNAYTTAIGKLRLLLNINQDMDIELLPPAAPEMEVGNTEGDAVQNNIQLIQLRAELAEANRAVLIANNARLPDVSLQVRYGQATFTDPFLAQTLPSTQQQWSINLQASTDLSRTAEKSNYQRARINAESLRINLEHKTNDIKRQVRQQILYVAVVQERIALREEQIQKAEGKLALAEIKFAHDMADNFDVIETETELQRARMSLLNTQVDYALSIYNLRAISGHLLDEFRAPSAQQRLHE